GPAPVIEPRLAREQLRVALRVVVHHQENLALEVGAFVVVPLVLGRHDAVADEDHLAPAGAGLRTLHAGEGHVVVAVAQVHRLAALGEADRGRGRAGDADDVEGLIPGAVGSARLQAQSLYLGGDVLLGESVALSGGPPSLEQYAVEVA